jgi:hypothetical protein
VTQGFGLLVQQWAQSSSHVATQQPAVAAAVLCVCLVRNTDSPCASCSRAVCLRLGG